MEKGENGYPGRGWMDGDRPGRPCLTSGCLTPELACAPAEGWKPSGQRINWLSGNLSWQLD